MKALTLWQPWAWWVASGWKPIENRPWPPPASAIGTIVGYVEKGQLHADEALESPWFFGPFGWKLAEIRPLEAPVPCKGSLGLWRVPAEVESEILRQRAGAAA